MRIQAPPLRVPWRLVASFLAFAVATLVFGGLVFHQAERWSQAAALEALRVTVRLGAHSMEQWLAERFADADVLATTITVLLSNRGDPAAMGKLDSAELARSLDAVRRRYSYRSVSVLDAAGQEVAQVSGARPSGREMEAALAVDALHQARWVDLPPSSSGAYRAAVVRRIAQAGPLSQLVLYLEVEPQQLARTLTASRSAGLHGSSVLPRRQRSTVVRFEPSSNAAGDQLVIAADVRPEHIEYLLLTTSRTEGRGQDLEGRQVLAVRADLSLTGWSIVGMLDDSSRLAVLRQQTGIAVLAYGSLMSLVVMGLAGWVRSERRRQTQREADVVEFYDKILRHGDALYTLTDWRGKLVDASHSALAAFGYTEQEMLGRDIMELVPEHARHEVRAMVHDMRTGESRAFIGERMRADGSTFLVQGSVGLLEIKGRRYFHSVGKDVSHERQVQARLLQAASVFDLAPAAIVVADQNLVVVSVNPAFTHITGYSAEEVVGKHVRTLATGTDPERTTEILSGLLRDDLWEGEIPGRRKSGEIYPRRMLAAAHRNADGHVDQYIGIFTDLSTLKQAEIKAQYHANHDQLTKLPNRRRLEQLLPEMVQIAAGKGASLTVAIFNLDRFKSVNDSFGLAEGDKLLVEVARRLQTVVPPERLYHFGADEFVAVLSGAPVVQALTIDRAQAGVHQGNNRNACFRAVGKCGRRELPGVGPGCRSAVDER